jgi:hypothetical protein
VQSLWSKAKLWWPVESHLTNQALRGAGFFFMSSDELYCIHTEQLKLRYPDAWHVRYAWGINHRRIESKVQFGEDMVMFISVLDPDGTVRHLVEPCKKKPVGAGFRTN